jgi:hypothetical protein
MAKGQKRSGREAKKPKATKKVVVAADTTRLPFPAKPAAKGNSK